MGALARLLGWGRSATGHPLRFRYERFGGIVQLGWPRALVFVDRDRARSLGYPDSGEHWSEPEPSATPSRGSGEVTMLDEVLTAPLEAHLQLTNRCAVGCRTCYTGATPAGSPAEWDLAAWRQAIDALAAQGVFHVALGGGESAELPWLGELAEHARRRGVIPNLTTSGLLDDAKLARLCRWAPLFGQINVSLDGLGQGYAAVRGVDGFAAADRAVVTLRRVTRHVGINCVLTRPGMCQLAALFAYARQRRLGEIELLRLKPAGRGAVDYAALRLDDAQHRALLPTVLELARRHRRRVRMDCSFTPMIAHHQPDPRLVRWLGITGCAGGDRLIAAKAHGVLTACSFAPSPPGAPTAEQLAGYWQTSGAFAPFRSWREAQEPCRSCRYLSLCRGGCRVVSAHVSGSLELPDPECPRVIDWRARHAAADSGKSESRRLPVLSQ